MNDMCWHSTVEDFMHYGIKLGEAGESKGRPNAHDEARESGSINLLSKRIKSFWDYIYEDRQLNMVQALIQANFWNIPRDIIYHRALFMLWVVEDIDWNNGTFYFFSKRAMKKLYLRGKRTFDLEPHGYDYHGRFVDFWAGHPDYLTIKKTSFIDKYKESVKEGEEAKINDKDFLMAAFDRLMFNDKINVSKFCEWFGISPTYYYEVRKQYSKVYNTSDDNPIKYKV